METIENKFDFNYEIIIHDFNEFRNLNTLSIENSIKQGKHTPANVYIYNLILEDFLEENNIDYSVNASY